ncbi:MAG: HU family DNA-binding protein [Paludibacteraceae bacterium]|nr:HU family DNA-binding protein [Paludibacteraceae bacterium]
MATDTNKLTWVRLRQSVAKESGIAQKDVALFLSCMIDQMTVTMQKGESIRISGLGTFYVQDMAPRKSVNVKTGESIIIQGYHKPGFTMERSTAENMNYVHNELTPMSDPIRKLNDQADEILNILADMGQGPQKVDSTEETPTPTAEETTQIPTEPTQIPEEPTVEQPSNETQPAEKEIELLPIDDIQSPPVKKEFHPWMTAGITMSVFCLLLIGGYLFLQHKIEVWANHLQEKVGQEITVSPSLTDEISFNEEIEEETTTIDNLATSTESIPDNTANATQVSSEEETTPHVNPQGEYTEFIATEILAKDSRLAWVAKKHYGEKKFWVYIYDANRDQLTNPSVILPGTRLRIPKLSKEQMDLTNPDTQRSIKEMEDNFLNRTSN